MKNRYRILVLSLITGLAIGAAERRIPKNYYTILDGKSMAQLKTAVCTVIYPHTKLSYSSLWNYYKTTDVYPGGTQWWDMYSDVVRYVSAGNSGMNKEHSFPKSWWGGTTTVNAYTDLNHLYPSDEKANSAKSNWPLGEVDRTKKVNFDNGCSITGTPVSGQGGGAATVFEPDDRYKGDLARAYFYMATCYQDLTWDKTYMVNSETYPTLNAWSREMLLRWHRQDPVSQKEIDRNEEVYRYQGNRNPFIDFPDLAEYIWGDMAGQPFILADHIGSENEDPDPAPGGEPTLLSPSQDFVLEFGEVALGHDGSAILLIRGANLDESKSLRLAVYDNAQTHDASLFTIDGESAQTVSCAAANRSEGLNVRIDYNPVAVGEHETRLVISRGGLTGSIGIKLHGTCLPTPVLTAPKALEATDVTDTGYTARWEPAAGETVDYYIVNRTQYIGGSARTMQIEVSGDTQLAINDFCGSESYTVQSVRLDVQSAQSNSVSVTQGAITGVEYGAQFGAGPYPGGLLITTPAPIATLRAYDLGGRLTGIWHDVQNNDVVELPKGVYILTADGTHIHIKAQVF